MRGLVLFSLVALTASAGRFDRTNSRCEGGRSDRGFACDVDNLAFFEAFPANGAGVGAACACTTPTGAKGETMTFTRAGDATCSKQGLATTGILDGDLVVCAANQPRVESSGSVLGLRVEGARTNVLPRFIDYSNAAWADVGTPTLTGGQTSPFTGALSASAVQFDDNDGAAFEGRTQTVTVTAATAYTQCCLVKAGTLATARLSLDGTTADVTGLSSSTWTLASVTDASSSGVAIAAQVLNGSTAAATGTVIWGGCQVEAGSYCTSMQPTVAAAVVRNADVPYFAPLNGVAVGSIAATMQSAGFRADATPLSVSTDGDNRVMAYFPSAGASSALGNFSRLIATNRTFTTGAVTAANTTRVGVYYPTSTEHGACINGTCATGAVSAYAQLTGTAATRVYVGAYLSTGFEIDGIVTSVCVDPSPTRCR